MSKSFYITTAIDYANGSPHIGHAYEKVLADVIARFEKMQGKNVYFVTGLDEHGQKVQQTALKAGQEPLQLCDGIAKEFQEMCKSLDIGYDDFIRTTQDRHKRVVQACLHTLYEEGLIYKADYKGFYSQRAEQFLQEKEKVDGKWPEIFGEVVEIIESNYFFKLSKYQDWLIEYIKAHPDFIFPKFRAKQVLEFLKEPINDLCISRPKSRLSWGIELPFDEDFVTYVWFDALINYISVIDYGQEKFSKHWPVDYHIIGKDILVPAHAVYWPIMLKALGIELPKCLLVHGWWLIDGDKMSKSKGNIINPLEVIGKFSPDAFRYFLMKEMNVGQDSNFSYELFLARYNDDLGNDLGNLVSRLLHMINRYTQGIVPEVFVEEEPEVSLKSAWEEAKKEVMNLYSTLQFHTGLSLIFNFIRGINRYAEARSPWKLAKSELKEDQERMQTALFYMAEALRLSTVVLTPIMPTIAYTIQKSLGVIPALYFSESLTWGNSLCGKKVGDKVILFPKADVTQAS